MKHFKLIPEIFITALLIITQLTYSQVAPQSKEMTSSILLSGLQMNVTNNITHNKEQILEGIGKAFRDGSNFLVTRRTLGTLVEDSHHGGKCSSAE